MEHFFCFGKKDFCNSELCSLNCEFCDDSGGLEWNQLEIVFKSIFGEDYNLSRLQELVQADKERKRGIPLQKWIHLGGDEWCCRSCGNVIYTEGSWEKPRKKYCEECGAKMDVEQEE